MPRKQSIKRSAQDFREEVDDILSFLEDARGKLKESQVSWAFEYSIIRLYREFESMMLDVVTGALNHDTSTLSSQTGVAFPKHMTAEVCEYLVTGGRFFDFRGRDGLLSKLRNFVTEDHYLLQIVKQPKHKAILEQLTSFRDYAAHDSESSKTKAKEAAGQERLGSAGSWLKSDNRLERILVKLRGMAQEIEDAAPC